MADTEELIELLMMIEHDACSQMGAPRARLARIADYAREAATALSAQQREIAELREALSRIAGNPMTHNNDSYDYRNIARAALNTEREG